MSPHIISIIGALNADLIMLTNRVPEGGESLRADSYHEALGGKGANSAIGTYRACHRRPADTHASGALSPQPGSPVDEDEQATLKPSSSAASVDIEVRIVGAVGDDKYADVFHTELTKNGVDTSGLRTIEGRRSGVCFVMVEHYTGENRCLFTLGANEAWKEEDFLTVESLASGPKPELVIAQMEIRKGVVQQMIETAGKAGIDFLLNAAPADPIDRRHYRYITHLLVNESEAAIMSGRELSEVEENTWPKIAQEFIDRGVKNVVLTLGAHGAYYATEKHAEHVLAYRVDVLDSTGAGDTFTGAYAAEYVRQRAAGEEWDIRRAIVRANKAAALTITKIGAQQGIPWADEIDAFEGELLVAEVEQLDVNTQGLPAIAKEEDLEEIDAAVP